MSSPIRPDVDQSLLAKCQTNQLSRPHTCTGPRDGICIGLFEEAVHERNSTKEQQGQVPKLQSVYMSDLVMALIEVAVGHLVKHFETSSSFIRRVVFDPLSWPMLLPHVPHGWDLMRSSAPGQLGATRSALDTRIGAKGAGNC